MNTYDVVVTVSTTVRIDAESPDDAIEKVSRALNNDDANMSADVASRIPHLVKAGYPFEEREAFWKNTYQNIFPDKN